MKCPKCGKQIDNDSRFCEYCGAKIEKSKRGLWITLGVILLSVCIGVLGVYVYESLQRIEAENSLRETPVETTDGHEWVDLGLPSGTKWAATNVGANTPEGYGNYYAWGETTTKSTYNWSTYKWCKGSFNTQTKYCTSSKWSKVDYKLDLSDDAAYVNWGSSWRMPTSTEQDELSNTSYTTWTWTTQNGVKGYKVTSKSNGNSIFLPAAGYRFDSSLYDAGSNGKYWSSSLNTDYSDRAYFLILNSSNVCSTIGPRFSGFSVRPVLR